MSTKTISRDLLKNTRIIGSQSASLPITRDLTLAYALSFAIALLVAVAAVGGLLFRNSVYPTEKKWATSV